MAHFFVYRAGPGCWVSGDRTFGPFAATTSWQEALESIARVLRVESGALSASNPPSNRPSELHPEEP